MKDFSEIQNQILRISKSAKLLAVSKLQPAENIKLLYDKGQRLFGENYVQEFLQKKSELVQLEQIQWHFIGNLQSNKVKDIAGKCDVIHSIDSLKLMQKLSSVLVKNQARTAQKVLLQINLADEKSKGGFLKNDLDQFKDLIWNQPLVSVVGLMTLPPLQNEAAENRTYFRELKNIFDELNHCLPSEKRLVELSMGTSHDFHIALEEGATLVRLGTALFGERTP